MKFSALVILLFALIACNNNASTPLVKNSENKKTATTPKPTGIVIPVVKYGIEGFYTGFFVAKEYDEKKEILDNKITVCIDSLNEKNIYGHSVVAGNERPFYGPYKKQNNIYSVSAKEPGDNKYDGVFEFTLDKEEKKIKGTWTSNDKKLTVTKREYELKPRQYKYDPSLRLPVDITQTPIYGTYNSKNDKAEAVTKDVLKRNASKTVLKSSDVENMYQADLEVLRNSIYARHGYSFKNPRMRSLFDSYVDWYMPVSTNVTALLTDIEKKNIELIKRYEAHATKYYDVFGR